MSGRSVDLRKEFASQNLEQLADELAHGPSSERYHAANAEFVRRTARAQIEAAEATKKAANAQRVTAVATIVLIGATLVTALATYWAVAPNSPHQSDAVLQHAPEQ